MNARAQAHMDKVNKVNTMKEDAGVSIDADRPYNFVERMFLRILGTLTARQLI